MATEASGVVYFIQNTSSKHIKIGCTTRSVEARLAELQTGSAEPLRILCTIPGHRRSEEALHKRFAAHRLEGEWFAMSAELSSFIDGILSANGEIHDGAPGTKYVGMAVRAWPLTPAAQAEEDERVARVAAGVDATLAALMAPDSRPMVPRGRPR